jgi:hypothetical protein
MFTNEQVEHMLGLLEDVRRYRLDTAVAFKDTSLNTQLETYNGCGADWQPDWLRDLQTMHFHFFESAFVIHDWDFRWLPKDRKSFNIANKRLLRNCKKIIRKEIAWWRFIERHRRLVQAREIYFAVDKWGFEGFMAAVK